jgi:hypothetical protein
VRHRSREEGDELRDGADLDGAKPILTRAALGCRACRTPWRCVSGPRYLCSWRPLEVGDEPWWVHIFYGPRIGADGAAKLPLNFPGRPKTSVLGVHLRSPTGDALSRTVGDVCATAARLLHRLTTSTVTIGAGLPCPAATTCLAARATNCDRLLPPPPQLMADYLPSFSSIAADYDAI